MSLESFLFEALKIIFFPGFVFIFILALFYEWFDRKFYAKLQNRVGPLYAGPLGILQPLADFIKLLSKEDIVPKGVDKVLFTATPLFSLSLSIFATLLLPIFSVKGLLSFEGDLVIAVVLLTFLCIITFFAGVASYNRFSIIGAERSFLQLIGYEIPLMISVISVALNAQSVTISSIVSSQKGLWYILGPNILGFIVFIFAAQAELERIPFDLPEAEQELIAGWNIDYTGRRLAMFRLAKNIELVFLCGLAAALFLGGPLGPVVSGYEPILYTIYFIIKSIFVLAILTIVRALFARLRIDQIVSLSWKYLLPLAIIQFLIVRLMI
ncbi:MAG: NADH-quinone oxidoreductase subunit H [Nitrososphaeria archaeon]|nr:NADH-quinone oxidoreductase subunit H [Nitrososphaeria archaeon]